MEAAIAGLALSIVKIAIQAETISANTEDEKNAMIEKLKKRLAGRKEAGPSPLNPDISLGVDAFLEGEIARISATITPISEKLVMPEVKILVDAESSEPDKWEVNRSGTPHEEFVDFDPVQSRGGVLVLTFSDSKEGLGWLLENKDNIEDWKTVKSLFGNFAIEVKFNEANKLRKEIQDFFGDKRVDMEHIYRAFKLDSGLFEELMKGRKVDGDDIRTLSHNEDESFVRKVLAKYQIFNIEDLCYPLLANRSDFLKIFAEEVSIFRANSVFLFDVVESQPLDVANIWLKKYYTPGMFDHALLSIVIARCEPNEMSLFEHFSKCETNIDDLRYALLKKKRFLAPKIITQIAPHQKEKAKKMLAMCSF
jgi:hypothetical protein